MEEVKLTPKQVALSVLNAGIMAIVDFGGYLLMVLYMTGLAAGAISILLNLGLPDVQLPSFLAIWAGLSSLRIVVRSLKLEM